MNQNFTSINKNNFFAKIPFKSFISGLSALAFIILFVVLWSASPKTPQISDTNGPDNYSLETISDIDIVNNTCKNTGVNKGKNEIEKTITYTSKQFSGTEKLNLVEFGGNGDKIDILKYDVKSGNARLVAVENGKIVYEFVPNSGAQSFVSKGNDIDIVLAGESADFELTYSTQPPQNSDLPL